MKTIKENGVIIYKFNYDEPTYPVYQHPHTVKPLIDAVVKICKTKFKDKKIGFICRGSSGLYIATNCNVKVKNSSIIYVRKEDEVAHGGKVENFSYLLDVYIVVDDFVSTGETIKAIISNLKSRYNDFDTKNIGIAAHNAYNNVKEFDNFFKFYIV